MNQDEKIKLVDLTTFIKTTNFFLQKEIKKINQMLMKIEKIKYYNTKEIT